MAPGGQGLHRQDAGDVDIGHAGLGEHGLEHGVQANHMEQVYPVVGTHLVDVRQLLQYTDDLAVDQTVLLTVSFRPSCPRVPALCMTIATSWSALP